MTELQKKHHPEDNDDKRPQNLAKAIEVACVYLDAFDTIVRWLHEEGYTGFELQDTKEILPLPEPSGDGMQRDLREVVKRIRESEHQELINSLWPEEQVGDDDS